MADHQLSSEEETLLMEVAAAWDLSPEIRQRLRQMIRELGEMREMHSQGAPPIHASRTMKRGESCYLEDDGKFLRRATLSSYTSQARAIAASAIPSTWKASSASPTSLWKSTTAQEFVPTASQMWRTSF
ncbi:hypothetical protein [Nitritalea halalkaliphila]|uniref:hypothetical protein n=1 Tax=Nitritalea halalkaliphila TaxID=590849 RepID=UPI0012EAC960|nr:hypothetical protein [Nitritalea halalkaliphila]